ncbi:MAG: GatB/YqeY domain-containing protein [Candidatus Omnitrophota bacterium]|jgi:hypothetical protein
MDLYNKIEADIKSALRSGDSKKLSVLRMALSEIKNHEINKKLKKASEGDVLQIMQRQVNQHKDSIEQFEKGNRPDLVQKEKAELEILVSYMPKQLSEEELAKIIGEVISTTGAVTKSETGKVMKAVMEKVKGRSDGKTINQLVMRLLK